MFWECVHIQRLWQNVIAKFELRELRSVHWVDIHLGLFVNSPRIKIFNIIFFCNEILDIYMQGKVGNIVFV